MAMIHLSVKGMTCESCTASIRSYLEDLGATKININIGKESIDFNMDMVGIEDTIREGIEKMGYKIVLDSDESAKSNAIISKNQILLIAILLTIPLILNHIIHSFVGHGLLNNWVQLLMTSVVYIIGINHFGRSSYFALKNGKSNMNVLIFMGSSAAFFYSLYGLLQADHNMIFFETTASIITLVLLGNWIEKRSMSRTNEEIDGISDLLPDNVTRILPNELFETIQVEDLMLGDRIMVREGENIPVDGEIIRGEARVNEALLTGESDQIIKEKGDLVISGSYIESGHLEIMMTRTNEESYIQKIVELIKKGLNEKPKIQRLADQISAWFVPLVVGISIFVFLLEYYLLDYTIESSLLNAIAVLVVSCPCAMGLATPTALAVGLGRLARTGIIVKGKDAIQKVASAKNFVFDKTGTITNGQLVIDQWNYIFSDNQRIDSIVYSMEAVSNHPISKTILSHLSSKQLHKINFYKIEEHSGKGITSIDSDNTLYYLGKDPNQKYDVILTINGTTHLEISFKEHIVAGSKKIVNYLKEQQKNTILLSGDRKQKVESLAKHISFDSVFSAMNPKLKYKKIEEFSDDGGAVMIGDGVNDAPALQRANVGVSFFNSSGIAQSKADIILMKPDLILIKKLLEGSKAIVRTIRQNLFWAFIYNIIAIPLAAMGYLSPMLAAVSMAFSDLIVIANSLLIRRKF